MVMLVAAIERTGIGTDVGEDPGETAGAVVGADAEQAASAIDPTTTMTQRRSGEIPVTWELPMAIDAGASGDRAYRMPPSKGRPRRLCRRGPNCYETCATPACPDGRASTRRGWVQARCGCIRARTQ